MRKLDVQKLAAQLDKRMKEVATVRDKLDDTIGTFKSIQDDCREAYDDLQRARDSLSRLV